jgi:hypothetical protein
MDAARPPSWHAEQLEPVAKAADNLLSSLPDVKGMAQAVLAALFASGMHTPLFDLTAGSLRSMETTLEDFSRVPCRNTICHVR